MGDSGEVIGTTRRVGGVEPIEEQPIFGHVEAGHEASDLQLLKGNMVGMSWSRHKGASTSTSVEKKTNDLVRCSR
jgi:hypothetical protein